MLDKHQFGTLKEDENEPDSQSSVSCVNKFQSDWLGVEMLRIWHGYPDARFRIDKDETVVISHDDLEEGSPGDSTVMEAKVQFDQEVFMQLVSTSVVVAFTGEKTLHRDLSPCNPYNYHKRQQGH